jgi:molecular chaperone GrpE
MSKRHSDSEPPPQADPVNTAARSPEAGESTRPAVETQAELADVQERLLRALAEQENIRRRAQRELRDALKFAAADVAKDLLATADNLSRAIASVPQENAADDAVRRWVEGIEATERGLRETFERHGIRRIDPIGEVFDPNRHQAMFEVPDDQHPDGTVATVVQPGYLHHDRLLRPALVGVAKAKEAASSTPQG